ncbi:MAG: DEAD/DEAH box helicase [Candidatus Methanomethylophilaceae archaeon]|jgi:ATP-dependent Lhr-like helicase|nr:ATP-dependent helicase [Methanomassiliicoccales archaeon RumEn M2]MDD2532036.1 DEAD/DEAH box helicase [Candidatus Methanomethylophilaceae archaeon]MDD3127764.1 DEAD/DEAH box helicase [Candidatus Methanomethylophilaceae archaeon]MDD4454010.1 DEAD/DEAH box helicase [Candidatus Methanomethylophilaceae archaeon]MDI9378896.1 DEAD/DEAH box helicase [Candidatus Thermoplasmatota archaeon]
MSFEGLSAEIIKALGSRGIFSPTEPQADAIPRISRGENLLLVAPTGIGKTEAAMIPIFDAIFRTKGKKGIRCLYITPLRALNRDMLKRMEDVGNELGITVGVRHGDTSQAERNKQSQKPPEILITTPETVQVLFTGKRLREHLKNVEWVVVDEIHELADVERGAQLSVAMERLVSIAGEYQRIGLSATVGNPTEVLRFLGGVKRKITLCRHDTHRDFDIGVECPDLSEDSVLLDRLQCEPDILAVMLRARELIDNGRSTLFFVNTRETAEWLAARFRMWDEDIGIEVHHGSLSKETRMEMEDAFKSGEIKALVCTSSLELGIDVGSTDLVIQYNSPRQVARMIQRAGRAGHRVGGLIHARILATAPDEVAESLVVARKAEAREMEAYSGRGSPLTVVANQLIAMTMTSRIDRDTAYSIFRRSHSFRDLKREEMDAVLEQLKSIKMVFEDEDGFRRSKKGMDYFYSNISMIPDERTYLIRDVSNRGIVGTLDESFVASFAEPYAMFIAKGRTWRIIEMREDEILVEEAREIGSVPSWTGSDIPVPFDVAMEVGRMRRTMDLDIYPGDENAKECVRRFVSSQKGFDVPSDRLVTVEIGDRVVIINACFGTRVNETLSKIISALLSARLGESVGASTDPYRIILQIPRSISKDLILDTISSIEPGTVESLARLTIVNSTFLRWRFVYVAKKFGIIEKNADHRFMNFGRLFDLHKGTPAYNEAVNKVLWEDLDIESTEKVISMIRNGSVEVRASGVSPIGLEGVTRSKELMQPARADHSILMALKKRLENETLYASCLSCRTQWRVRVGSAPKRFVCSKCRSRMVALLKEYDRESIKLLAKKDLTDDEKKETMKISRNANLVKENELAPMALAGRGIGPDSASRILRGMHRDEDDFLRDILSAEVLYARNKRFWD